MQPGELRTLITIQHLVKTGTGSFAEEQWQNVCTVFAKWVNVHGSEAWTANSIQANKASTVTIRYIPNISEKCRIVLDEINYDIVSIDNIRQLGQWLEIKVKASVNG